MPDALWWLRVRGTARGGGVTVGIGSCEWTKRHWGGSFPVHGVGWMSGKAPFSPSRIFSPANFNESSCSVCYRLRKPSGGRMKRFGILVSCLFILSGFAVEAGTTASRDLISSGELELILETASRSRTGSELRIALTASKTASCQINSMASAPSFRCVVQFASNVSFHLNSGELAMILRTMKTTISGGSKQFQLNDQSLLRCRMNDFSQPVGFACRVQPRT